MEVKPNRPNSNATEAASPHVPIVYENDEYYWQYKYVCQNMNKEGLLDETELNQLGKEGWELVTVFILDNDTAHYYFKRPAD